MPSTSCQVDSLLQWGIDSGAKHMSCRLVRLVTKGKAMWHAQLASCGLFSCNACVGGAAGGLTRPIAGAMADLEEGQVHGSLGIIDGVVAALLDGALQEPLSQHLQGWLVGPGPACKQALEICALN